MSATDDRLEPDVAAIDQRRADASLAISLKRIADTLDRLEHMLTPGEIVKAILAMQPAFEQMEKEDLRREHKR